MNSEITNPALGSKLQSMKGLEFFQAVIPRFLALGLLIGTLIFFFVLVVGAIQWIYSGGDKTALEGARSKIINAVIGIVILFSVFIFLKAIESFFGITIMTLDIGPIIIQ